MRYMYEPPTTFSVRPWDAKRETEKIKLLSREKGKRKRCIDARCTMWENANYGRAGGGGVVGRPERPRYGYGTSTTTHTDGRKQQGTGPVGGSIPIPSLSEGTTSSETPKQKGSRREGMMANERATSNERRTTSDERYTSWETRERAREPKRKGETRKECADARCDGAISRRARWDGHGGGCSALP